MAQCVGNQLYKAEIAMLQTARENYFDVNERFKDYNHPFLYFNNKEYEPSGYLRYLGGELSKSSDNIIGENEDNYLRLIANYADNKVVIDAFIKAFETAYDSSYDHVTKTLHKMDESKYTHGYGPDIIGHNIIVDMLNAMQPVYNILKQQMT